MWTTQSIGQAITCGAVEPQNVYMYFMIIEYTICSFWNSSSHIHITIVIYAKNGALIIYYCIVAIFFLYLFLWALRGKWSVLANRKSVQKVLTRATLRYLTLIILLEMFMFLLFFYCFYWFRWAGTCYLNLAKNIFFVFSTFSIAKITTRTLKKCI